LANTFAIESFMDELAYAAGEDPLTFRLKHLPEDETGTRLGRVLQTAADLAGWGSPSQGRALGIAACMDAGTAVAQVAEVSVEGKRIRVHRVHCAIDPGLPINPDGVAAQTQGAIIMGLSSTLLERVVVENGRIVHSNFDTYPLITMADAPDVQVEVIRSGDQPYGMGEPPIGPIAAAVANGLFALTGQRVRELPLVL
jgi:isoquinoline 1-oxidoreductase beta subunit